jgi:hypothetical protein
MSVSRNDRVRDVPPAYAPEIERTSLNPDGERRTVNTETEDLEKSLEKRSRDEEAYSDEENDIVYHYLTFETELPAPTTIYPSREDQEQPPQQPDLVQYMSPFDWTDTRKSIIIWISCVITSLTAFTAGAYSPGVGQMTKEWHVSNVAALIGITTFCCGTYPASDIL